MLKLCHFPAVDDRGNRLVEIFHHPDQLHHSYMDKVAAPFLPQVRQYLDNLKPDPRYIYSLVNALGAYEYWSSNLNGDGFEEEVLLHPGPIWGYETFTHYARPYMHHANKDPRRAFGDVQLSCWNPNMRRVELVVRLDRVKAREFNADSVIDKIDHGQHPNTSMGTKVPYDLCSITIDWPKYRRALTQFNARIHRHAGIAVLQFHKKDPIRGLSVTRKDYSDFCKHRMNEILPDGRKVFVYNPFPRFFDISFVFFGADKTSKQMAKLASGGRRIVVPSNYMADYYGYEDQPEQFEAQGNVEKVASIESARQMLRDLKEKKASQRKRAEIIKDVVPSQFLSKGVPVLERSEPSLGRDILDMMSEHPLSEALSTPSMMGITLKPKEFQRIVLCRLGEGDKADEFDSANKVFRNIDDMDRSTSISGDNISGRIADMLKGFIGDRSALGPPLRRRMIKITITQTPKPEEEPDEIADNLLDKISAAYNGYRHQAIEKMGSLVTELHRFPEAQAEVYDVGLADVFTGMAKEGAGIDPRLLLGAIPATYLLSALARRSTKLDYGRGKRPGVLKELLGSHPHLAASVVGLAALKASGSKIPDNIVKGALTAGKRLAGLG